MASTGDPNDRRTIGRSRTTGRNSRPWKLWNCIICFSLVAFIRILVGYQPHSGQDNYQGPNSIDDRDHRPYGGDYEAQRHWMEITYHLPISQWYYYDTHYWGLDYPPLTAYHSYLCGYICQNVFHLHESIALDTSRGYENSLHKAYMRSTVLISDLLFYGSAIWMFATSLSPTALLAVSQKSVSSIWVFLYCMIQPSILLIDHGHFQYNTVALGLSLWSIYYISKRQSSLHSSNMKYCIIGSVFFSCALSFKQMTLYYAPPIFFYLLGRCCAITTTTTKAPKYDIKSRLLYISTVLYRVGMLGISVIFTFAILWWPFIVYGPEDRSVTTLDRIRYMFERIIPIQRGLFEGKVSNVWCTLSVAPFRIRQRIPIQYQPLAALLLTLCLLIPTSVHMFAVGCRNRNNDNNSILFGKDYDRQQLLWGITNSALAFFLASFQVHEKSLLLALAPCSLLLAYTNDTTLVHWFAIVTTWTLWPLLQIDRLQTAYYCTILIFLATIGLQKEYYKLTETGTEKTDISVKQGFFDSYAKYYFDWIPAITYTIMIALHVAECIVVVPEHLPDLFPVLWSIIGCGFCCLAYSITVWHMCFSTTLPNQSRAVDNYNKPPIDGVKYKAL